MFQEIILIPAYNEIASLKKIINKIKRKKVIVVNDGSTDNTSKFLKKKKIEEVCNKKNMGYEKSLIIGFKYIFKKYPKISAILTFDADGEHKVSDIQKILKFFKKKKLDLLICDRKNIIRSSEKLISYFFWLKFKIKDPLTGLKVYKTSMLKKILSKIKSNYFLVDLAKLICVKNYKVKNYPITCNTIESRQARVGNKFYVNIKILRILNEII